MKDMETYYHVAWSRGNMLVLSAYWVSGVSSHDARMYCGNVFHTRAEAEENKYKVYERMTGKKWEQKYEGINE